MALQYLLNLNKGNAFIIRNKWNKILAFCKLNFNCKDLNQFFITDITFFRGTYMIRYIFLFIFTSTLSMAQGQSNNCDDSEQIQDTLNHDFSNWVKRLDGVLYYGTTPYGQNCSVLLKDIVFRSRPNTLVPIATHRQVVILGSLNNLDSDLMQAKEIQELEHILSLGSAKVFYELAGWCGNCGSLYRQGRVSGITETRLEFFNQGETPQNVKATIVVDEAGIKKVHFDKYAYWYLPLVNWSPSKVAFECIINRP